ncbi:MAG: UpxY family transcription antiterminator [Bacteroidales bacterium]|nr:UpxY family transcription antiterminator [Candidatus Cacconaster merdequi]
MKDSGPLWYVAYVKSCQEKKTASALEKLGVECFLPVQKVRRRWSDRWKIVDVLLIPRHIFLKVADDGLRRELLSDVYGLSGYMMDPAVHRPLTVPDRQLEDFRLMVEKMNGQTSSISVTGERILPGDMVKVVAGPLNGMTAECVQFAGHKAVVIRLGLLGSATVEVKMDEVEKLEKQ